MSVYLNQLQHFDLGVVTLSPQSAIQAGYSGALSDGTTRYARLRTITANSTNGGAIDPFSKPAILSLGPEVLNTVSLQIEAVNRTTYAFRYESGSEWKTVGWGNSSQVSGGFTGMWHRNDSLFLIVRKLTYTLSRDDSWSVRDWKWKKN